VLNKVAKTLLLNGYFDYLFIYYHPLPLCIICVCLHFVECVAKRIYFVRLLLHANRHFDQCFHQIVFGLLLWRQYSKRNRTTIFAASRCFLFSNFYFLFSNSHKFPVILLWFMCYLLKKKKKCVT